MTMLKSRIGKELISENSDLTNTILTGEDLTYLRYEPLNEGLKWVNVDWDKIIQKLRF